jgi:hypothetical protein
VIDLFSFITASRTPYLSLWENPPWEKKSFLSLGEVKEKGKREGTIKRIDLFYIFVLFLLK